MPKILVETPFPFAVDGNHVTQVEAGEQEVSDRCALVAVEHLGFAALVDGAFNTETDPLKMKVLELKEWLIAKGITFDPQAKKDDLLALVPKND